eukprot:TRINITY_DN3695_c0_g1_i2.p1 TRINITY_DN3695_c0_g1~~TRINITY_DN3695_c0_g1_i2.p1  ORF type:complete len:733 (+),score=150.04 TRINITY_DN3695_c0_g1_i2:250-2448(+)
MNHKEIFLGLLVGIVGVGVFLKRNTLSKLLFSRDAENELIDACKKGDVEKVRKLLKDSSVDVLEKDEEKWNALHWASFNGNKEVVLALLSTKKFDVNAVNGALWTPLLVATAKGNSDVIRDLILAGADVNSQTPSDQTPLIIASCNGYTNLVEEFLSFGADATLATNPTLETALYLASHNGHENVVAILLSDPETTKHTINFHNMHGATPLHAACGLISESTPSIIRLLIKNGADINFKKKDGCTPVHIAAIRNNIEALKTLFECNSSINLDTTSKFGTSPLQEACFLGNVEVVKYLLSRGASVELRDNDGLTPLHSACSVRQQTEKGEISKIEDRLAIIRLLHEAGANINGLDRSNSTPLHTTAFRGEEGFEIAKVLLELGANPTLENIQKWTPLHISYSQYGYPPTAKLIEDFIREKYPNFFQTFDKNQPRNIENQVKHLESQGEGQPLKVEEIVDKILSGEIKKIVTLIGAGISVSAGIPDFRNPVSGIYSSGTAEKYGLPSGNMAFDPYYISKNPVPFYRILKDLIYPVYTGDIKPTLTHKFLRLLYEKDLLLRCYTQNIDGLETAVGLPDSVLVESHGSAKTASCMSCLAILKSDLIWDALSKDEPTVAHCPNCGGIVRPNFVFFGEGLPKRFHELSLNDLRDCDLLIVMGTSLKVYPFAALVNEVSRETPRLLINNEEVGPFKGYKEALEKNLHKFSRDCCIIDDCDNGVIELSKLLGWIPELEHK